MTENGLAFLVMSDILRYGGCENLGCRENRMSRLEDLRAAVAVLTWTYLGVHVAWIGSACLWAVISGAFEWIPFRTRQRILWGIVWGTAFAVIYLIVSAFRRFSCQMSTALPRDGESMWSGT